MIVFGFALLGVLLGVTAARRRKGNRLDMAQYGAAFGIAFAILGVIVTIVIARMTG